MWSASKMLCRLTVLTLLLLVSSLTTAYMDDELEEERTFIHPRSVEVEEAKAEYDRIVSYTKMPHFGTCWSDALAHLHSTCKTLTEDSQTRLAISFANCFLLKSGQEGLKCEKKENVTECLRGAPLHPPHFFQSYLHFFTHTQQICFYLASEEWQRRAETQVNRLMDASQSVSLQLEESRSEIIKVQSEILNSQKSALINSAEIVKNHEKLNESLASSQLALISNFRELQKSASETRMWIGDVADRISRLQNVFIDEFTGFYSLIFYVISGISSFMLTSTNRTAGARLWLYLLLVGTFFLERYRSQQHLAAFEMEAGGMPDSAFVTQYLTEEAWLLRKCFWSVSVCLLFYFAYKFEDLNVTNQRLNLTNQRLIMDLRQDYLQIKDVLDRLTRAGSVQVDGLLRRAGSVEPNRDSSISMPDKLREYAERFRRSMTPSFQEEPDSTPPTHPLSTPLHTLHEESEGSREGTPVRVRRERRSREVTPLSVDRLTPRRVLRSSVTREEGAPSGGRFFSRRLGGRREPTPEEINEGLQQLSDITNQAKIHLAVLEEKADSDE